LRRAGRKPARCDAKIPHLELQEARVVEARPAVGALPVLTRQVENLPMGGGQPKSRLREPIRALSAHAHRPHAEKGISSSVKEKEEHYHVIASQPII
jgi:hypothetical protein